MSRITPTKSLKTYARKFSDMFVRWPLYFNHGPFKKTNLSGQDWLGLQKTYSGGYMIRCALPTNAEQDFQRRQFQRRRRKVAVKRFQDFKSLGVFFDHNLNLGLRFWSWFWVICLIARNKAICGKILATRCIKLEMFPRRKGQRIHEGVEGELAGERHGCNDGWRGEEIHRLAIPIVPWFEVPIKTC